MRKTIKLIVTHKCNLRCAYCVQKGYRYSKAVIKFCAIKRIIDCSSKYWLNENEDVTIFFSGGEPLLQFELIKKTVSYAKKKFTKKNVLFKITTNGTLLNKEKIAFLKKNNFYIALSLDGDKLSHDNNRTFLNRNGSFTSSKKYLPDLVSYNNFNLNMVITPYNLENLTRNVDYFINNKVKIFKFMIDLYPYSNELSGRGWSEESFARLKIEFRKLIRRYYEIKKEDKEIEFPNLFYKYTENDMCSNNFRNAITLLPNGYAHVCFACYFQSFKHVANIFIIGNVMHGNFPDKLLNLNSRLQEIDKQILTDNRTVKELSEKWHKICFFFCSEGGQDSIAYLKFQSKIFKYIMNLNRYNNQ